MLKTLIKRLWRQSRSIWVRVGLISVLAFVGTFLAKLLGGFIPEALTEAVGLGAVNRLLDVLASSMLAVTTFSLSVMVTIHRSVSSQWSPRALTLHLRDTRTQMVLATFIGSYIYALNAIILLETPFFSKADVVVLFGMTLAVITLVVVTIIRWIGHLQTMGSLTDTAERIEQEARDALIQWGQRPGLGAHLLTDDVIIPDDAFTVPAWKTGYIRYIYEDALSDAARSCDALIYVLPQMGELVHKGDPVAYVTRPLGPLRDALEAGLDISSQRSPEQDPGFGLRMLSEVASKAMSPGINDAGTAIDMAIRVGRVIAEWPDPRAAELRHPALFIRPLNEEAMMREGFDGIIRDGAGDLSVMRALMAELNRLADHDNAEIARTAQKLRTEALARADHALSYEPDRAALRE